MAHLIGDALDKLALLPDGSEAKKRFLQDRNMAVYRYEQQQYELEEICATLEKAKIPFIPLKGSVIRALYPEPWMRTSCDIDILVDIKDLERAKTILVEQLNYCLEEIASEHDVSLYAPSGVHLELHHSLAESFSSKRINDILNTVWESLLESNSYRKAMSDEMFYFYHIAHLAKHFEIGGGGVRPFLDVYFLKQQTQYQTDACDELLTNGALLTFAKAVENTANAWFDVSSQAEALRDLQEYVLYAGMYADSVNRAAVQQVRNGGKIKNIFSRIFLPYEQLKEQYPNLENRKGLLLFYQIKRWVRLLFGKDSKNVAHELKTNAAIEKEKRQSVEKLLTTLGLIANE